ncbi:MAG: FadR family transcriptional regulator [Deltaproteobacteria bacterium]|nr:FadR family transcriptional regulator [Deltaproteobacteria bacterium]MBW1929312.1 FadR family transcriptional regulator [Deltaproteobacteria bacterium]
MKKDIVITESRKRVFEAILEYFKKALTSGNLKPGDRLLPERDLAAQFQVSRASLREALRALEMLGVLSVIPGNGASIVQPDPHSLSKVFGLAMSLRPTISENILEVRKIIECGAVRVACKRASPAELAYIKSTLSRMQKVSNQDDSGIGASQADFEFHKGVINATHNDFLIFLYEILEILLKRSHAERWKDALRFVPDAAEAVTKAHEGIYEAIVEGNEEKAEELMRNHFLVLDSRKPSS